MHELQSEQGRQRVRQRRGVRRRDDEESAWLDELPEGAKEAPGRFEVFDDLAGDDDLRGRERELPQLGRVLRVRDVGLVAEFLRPLDANRVEVDPDQVGRDVAEPLVEPPARCRFASSWCSSTKPRWITRFSAQRSRMKASRSFGGPAGRSCAKGSPWRSPLG
jgi:hypothetical protein